MMNRARPIGVAAAFVLLGGPIAFGLLADARTAADRRVLDEIQRAEGALSFSARRTLTAFRPDGAVTTVLRVDGRAGERKVEFVEARLPGDRVMRPEDRRRRPGAGPFSWFGRLQGAALGKTHAGLMARFGEGGLILRNYELLPGGRETVAGRTTETYALRPYRAGRPSYRLWVDTRNRMLLRFQVVAPDGVVVFEAGHDEIAFDPPFAPDAFERRGAKGKKGLPFDREPVTEEDLRGLGFVAWMPERLPAGFERRCFEVYRFRGLFEALHAGYTDGLAWMSVVQFRADNPFWQRLRPLIPGLGGVESGTARRIAQPGGTLLQATIEGTETFAAGQLSADEMEATIRSLRRAN